MNRRLLFLLFFISGFCGLLYQVIWIRWAFFSFGAITPVLSIVVSVFMLGLGGGSWAAGRLLNRSRTIPALRLYAASELIIGLGAFFVPLLFRTAEHLLLSQGEMQSAGYLAETFFLITLSLLPWCFCMGLTFPLMMAVMRQKDASVQSSFSFLYMANTAGAMAGALVTAFVLIELFGLRHTLQIAGGLNFSIAALCAVWPLGSRHPSREPLKAAGGIPQTRSRIPWALLFFSALMAMSAEVIWTRDFTPVLGTTVYAFALIVTVYLFATGVGSGLYRRHLIRGIPFSREDLVAWASMAFYIPIVLNTPSFNVGAPGALLSFFPFCLLLGYLTPLLIDQYAQGSPEKAGVAYAINVAGSMAGPLLASYLLLPALGARLSLMALSVPLLIFNLKFAKKMPRPSAAINHTICLVLALASALCSSYEERCVHPSQNNRIQRDYAATVLCCGEGWARQLKVNGIGMTDLSFIPKAMAHLPMVCFPGKPQSALMICFGMGTTYRSLLSWNVKTTAVELIPSVPKVFGYYFADADAVRRNPLGTVVIDDGRRFLKRTRQTFDIITLDPPPPVEASGSALLYSTEFYDLVKARLAPDGILQQWWPAGEERIVQAVARSLAVSFPYVRVYKGRNPNGFHFLAARMPIRMPSVEEFEARLPSTAAQDIREWSIDGRLRSGLDVIIPREIPLTRLLPPDRTALITDDHPYNEYYFLRRLWDQIHHRLVFVR